jgi:hypothetical protein
VTNAYGREAAALAAFGKCCEEIAGKLVNRAEDVRQAGLALTHPDVRVGRPPTPAQALGDVLYALGEVVSGSLLHRAVMAAREIEQARDAARDSPPG